MVEEILELGISHLELGYDLTMDLVAGVRDMVKQKAVAVESVHAFCPVPIGAPFGHPELFELTSLDPRARASAISHVVDTVHFASEVRAKVVVLHAGNVRMSNLTRRLLVLCEKGKQFSPKYERLRTKLLLNRDKRAQTHIDHLYASIERILPTLEETGVRLAMENLPSWESVPTEPEFFDLLRHFDTRLIGYWHDIGHGQVRQNLGLTDAVYWIRKLSPWLAGMHVHDVASPAMDHIMPPRGSVDFSKFAGIGEPDMPAVLEPRPLMPAPELLAAMDVLAELWGTPGSGHVAIPARNTDADSAPSREDADPAAGS